MKTYLLPALFFCLFLLPISHAQETTIRIGGVASSPKVVTIFKNLKAYLNKKGFKSDFVLYSDHKALVASLDSGETDIAWTSPIPHALYTTQAGGSQTLASREVDNGLKVTLVAREGSGIDSLDDLAGKRLVLGSTDNAEGSLLPMHYLEIEGVDLKKLKVVSLQGEKDKDGRRANTSKHVLQALGKGRGDAAVVLENTWNRAKDWREANPGVKQVWLSPAFCHCTFTAPKDFDTALGNQFTQLMTTMDPNDPLVAELNKLENTKSWVETDSKGYEALYEAFEKKSELLGKIKK